MNNSQQRESLKRLNLMQMQVFSRKGLQDKENIKMMRTGVVTIFYLRDPAINCCCRRELPPLDSNTLLWRRFPLTLISFHRC